MLLRNVVVVVERLIVYAAPRGGGQGRTVLRNLNGTRVQLQRGARRRRRRRPFLRFSVPPTAFCMAVVPVVAVVVLYDVVRRSCAMTISGTSRVRQVSRVKSFFVFLFIFFFFFMRSRPQVVRPEKRREHSPSYRTGSAWFSF